MHNKRSSKNVAIIGDCGLVPRPSHYLAFYGLQYAKTEVEDLNDVSVYVGRQSGGGISDQRNTIHACILFILNKEWYVFHFVNV